MAADEGEQRWGTLEMVGTYMRLMTIIKLSIASYLMSSSAELQREALNDQGCDDGNVRGNVHAVRKNDEH
jgi:hypothetical protein